jgi:plasmid stability protein
MDSIRFLFISHVNPEAKVMHAPSDLRVMTRDFVFRGEKTREVIIRDFAAGRGRSGLTLTGAKGIYPWPKREACPAIRVRLSSVRLRMASSTSVSHALSLDKQRLSDMESFSIVELTLSTALFNALRIAAHHHGWSIEAEIISRLSSDFLPRSHVSMSSDIALAAVAGALGIDGLTATS